MLTLKDSETLKIINEYIHNCPELNAKLLIKAQDFYEIPTGMKIVVVKYCRFCGQDLRQKEGY